MGILRLMYLNVFNVIFALGVSMRSCISFIIPTVKSNAGDIATLRSIARYKLFHENVEVIVQSGGGSAAKARNEGVKRSKCDILVLLDDDVEVEPHILDYTVSLARRGFIVILGRAPIWMSRLIAIKRELFFSIGGFDNRIILNGSEDIDFVLSAFSKSYKVVTLPPEIVGHVDVYSWGKDLRKWLLRSFNNSMIAFKHLNIAAHYLAKARNLRGFRRAMQMVKLALLPLGLRVQSRLRALTFLIAMAAKISGLLYYGIISMLISNGKEPYIHEI